MKIIKITLALLLIFPFYGQSQTLSKQLWAMANTCYSNLEDVDEDGKIDFDELIDDSKNGYLKIAGSWPTCGCGCSSVVGAFKDSKGTYTLLAKENWNCDWKYKLSTNRKIEDVLPKGFGISTFVGTKTIDTITQNAFFYLDIEIPRIGTDTKVSIKLIPLGIEMKSYSLLAYEYNQTNVKSLHQIREIVTSIKNSETLNFILKGEFNEISKEDKNIINKNIGGYNEIRTFEELKTRMLNVKKVYDLYSKIETSSLILGWDRTKARFYIKKKGVAPSKISFYEFLKDSKNYWWAAC